MAGAMARSPREALGEADNLLIPLPRLHFDASATPGSKPCAQKQKLPGELCDASATSGSKRVCVFRTGKGKKRGPYG